ncbi:MAG: hypothetical protein A3G34_17415 [Candidatus Lindowbacteria bacterium RIFCSPLOWO2_12_FULL_62_27]|nr:MAG: hypothetical protein A3G34_17415 [Candidatus Lindowbacteria bacterium RIFCSPLOWO2_12_FULL_62_27]
MEKRPQATLLKFPGTNCDGETARALRLAGFAADIVPFSDATRELICGSDLLVLPGGFSYGDYIGAGRLARLEIQRKLGDALLAYRSAGGLILGICNGFQILVQLGLLPEGRLIENASHAFLCRWVRLRTLCPDNPYLSALPDVFELPIAHREGRFVARPGLAESYIASGLAPLVYEDNVNGSACAIAGLQDDSGRVFGLMPHPERFLYSEDHYDPDWGSGRVSASGAPSAGVSDASPPSAQSRWGWGYYFFKSIYNHLVRRDVSVGAGDPR